MVKRFFSWLPEFLWVAMIISLPITSLPLVSKLAGGTMVAPLALIFALLLAGVWLLPRLLRHGGLPRQSTPLLWWGIAAFASSLSAFFIYLPPFREVNRYTNSLSGLVTLVIGVIYYVLASTRVDSPEKMQQIFRWVNWSAIPMLAWALAQSLAWELNQDSYPEWMWSIQRLLSSSGSLYNWRTTGMAYEPSWFGHQLSMFYLPWWLAMVVQRTSAHSLRLFKWITVESILLVVGSAALYLSFARGALASFLLMVSFLIIKATFWLIAWLRDHAFKRWPSLAAHKALRILTPVLITLIFAIIYLAGLAGAAFVYTRGDERMQDLGTMITQGVDFNSLAHGLFFGERVAFWQAGLEIFSEHPVLGVGLDNAGFFFPQKLTPYGWTMAEPYKMYYSSALPNTLSLWVRLLAETGILGFALFTSFLYLMWQSSVPLVKSSRQLQRAAGLAGQMVLIGLLMEGLSLDTFALPYYWISLGWLTAVSNLRVEN